MTELVYQPQLELLCPICGPTASRLSYFLAEGLSSCVCSPTKSLWVLLEQVIGSIRVVKFELTAEGKPELIKEPKIEFIDDGPGQTRGHQPLHRAAADFRFWQFGRRPADAGDVPRWGAIDQASPRILHHTDAEREWAYDRQSHVGKLDKALDEANAKGWYCGGYEDGAGIRLCVAIFRGYIARNVSECGHAGTEFELETLLRQAGNDFYSRRDVPHGVRQTLCGGGTEP